MGSDDSQALRKLLEAVGKWHGVWFPEVGGVAEEGVQSFWFGARHPRQRKFFRRLCSNFDATLKELLELHKRAPGLILSSDLPAQLRFCIFLDQQSRNQRSAEQGASVSEELDAHIAACSAASLLVVRHLLQRVGLAAACCGEPNASGQSATHRASTCTSSTTASIGTPQEYASLVDLLMEQAQATLAQMCFLTLVLRHTRQLEDVRTAENLLARIAVLRPASGVVEAFQRANAAVLEGLEAEAYVREAVATGEPELLEAHREESPSGLPSPAAALAPQPPNCCYAEVCLSPACGGLSVGPRCAAWVHDDSMWDELARSELCTELECSLRKHDLWHSGARLVLSYSGGVDSTAHLLLLAALFRQRRRRRAGEDGPPRLCCLFLAYPNREAQEVEAERSWVSWVCRLLGVELFWYRVALARPHAEGEREQNRGGAGAAANAEEPSGSSGGGRLTREEYECHTKQIRFRMYHCLLPEGTPGAVILGHHLDDIDENRLDHLQKGHVLGDVEGMRPWREVLGINLLRPLIRHRKASFQAVLARFPTPHLRDSTPAWSVRGMTRTLLDGLPADLRQDLLALLDTFGRRSAEVGRELEAAVEEWALEHTQPVELPRGTTGLALDLDALWSLDVGVQVAEVASLIEGIRRVWNPAASAARSCVVTQIQESDLSDVKWLLFERGFFVATKGILARRRGHFHTLDSASVNRRAVRHLYDNIHACAKPTFSGGLTQEIGYVSVASLRRVLLLYDASAYPGTDFKSMRVELVKACQTRASAAQKELAVSA